MSSGSEGSANTEITPAKKKRRRELTPRERNWVKIAWIFFGVFIALFIAQLLFYCIVWSINDWTFMLVLTMVLIAPGYLANAGMLIVGGGRPLDGGKVLGDGERLFGASKTVRGFFGGPLIFGVGIGMGIHLIFYATWGMIEPFTRWLFVGNHGGYVLFADLGEKGVDIVRLYFLGAHPGEPLIVGFVRLFFRVLCVSFGAAIGDLIGSFTKRRFHIGSGDPAWGIDQLDFITMVLLMGIWFVTPVGIETILVIIFALIFTPSVTLTANTVAYLCGWKKVPW